MATFMAGHQTFEADLIVFDKDGLMFNAEAFWLELANVRTEVIAAELQSEQLALHWAKLFGADTRLENGKAITSSVDPLGIMAVASPYEERTVTAGLICDTLGWSWCEARNAAISIFEKADKALDLSKAIRPQSGYVELMTRLIELDVPYCVATSDTVARTRDSMSLFGFYDNVRCVVTPEDVAEGKPAPDMLRLISKRLHVALSRIAMVGDSYVDVRMAHDAGCIGIGVNEDADMKETMRPYASAVLDSLRELVF